MKYDPESAGIKRLLDLGFLEQVENPFGHLELQITIKGEFALQDKGLYPELNSSDYEVLHNLDMGYE